MYILTFPELSCVSGEWVSRSDTGVKLLKTTDGRLWNPCGAAVLRVGLDSPCPVLVDARNSLGLLFSNLQYAEQFRTKVTNTRDFLLKEVMHVSEYKCSVELEVIDVVCLVSYNQVYFCEKLNKAPCNVVMVFRSGTSTWSVVDSKLIGDNAPRNVVLQDITNKRRWHVLHDGTVEELFA